ncbi:MAG: DUF1993 domain-containing protein [Woeseiaceae bacterium]
MTIAVHDLAIAPLLGMLRNLDAIVSKAERYADLKKIDPKVLINARLYPDMLPFVGQIRIATDTAKGAAARLSGNPLPSWPDEERTFAEVHERIQKAVDYLGSFKPQQFEGAEARNIELKLGPHHVKFTGKNYITSFVLPNFYFHVTAAYAILRHNGLEIGKVDYLGAIG